MKKIAVAGNTEPPIYHLILSKGYKIKVKEDYILGFKDEFELIANSIVELAGLILLIEEKGEDWKVSDDLIDDYCSLF